MFPGPNATVYRNEAGEPLGWDYPSEPESDYDLDAGDYERRYGAHDAHNEELYEEGYEAGLEAFAAGSDLDDVDYRHRSGWGDGYFDGWSYAEQLHEDGPR